MSGLRAAARIKPVIVVKAGRRGEGSRAALSHTGALVGADDVFDAVLARAGAVRRPDIEQLFAAAQLLANEHRVRGNRLAIVTNGGGPGVLAADRAADLGVVLTAAGRADPRETQACCRPTGRTPIRWTSSAMRRRRASRPPPPLAWPTPRPMACWWCSHRRP